MSLIVNEIVASKSSGLCFQPISYLVEIGGVKDDNPFVHAFYSERALLISSLKVGRRPNSGDRRQSKETGQRVARGICLVAHACMIRCKQCNFWRNLGEGA